VENGLTTCLNLVRLLVLVGVSMVSLAAGIAIARGLRWPNGRRNGGGGET
jgi:hypothetical protein